MNIVAAVVIICAVPAVVFVLLATFALAPSRHRAWVGRCSCGVITRGYPDRMDAAAALRAHRAVTGRRAVCAGWAITQARVQVIDVMGDRP